MSAVDGPDSPMLRALQRALRKPRGSAEARFWRSVSRSGTPLVEPVRDDPTRSWVTYLWRGNSRTRSVAIVTHQEVFGVAEMSRLPGSQTWYLTSSLRNDFMGTYSMFPNRPPVPPEDVTGFLRMLRRGKLDPWNPRRFDIPRHPELPHNPQYGFRFSVLHLKDAPNHPELIRRPGRPTGSVEIRHLRSRVLKNSRRVWVYTPPQASGADGRASLVIFFDGLAYVNEISAPTTLDNLLAGRRIPPTYALFVDALDWPNRNRELLYNPDFGRFLLKELLPWSRRILGRSFPAERTVLAGHSNGGLCALYWAMRYPNHFRGVISQSGWLTWRRRIEDEPVPLAREFMRRRKLPLRIYMDAGRYESLAGVAVEDGAGVLGCNRHLRDVLRLKGYPVMFQTFNGGHDKYCSRQTLVDALPWVLS